MATYAETARFFRLALRVGLASTVDVECWIDDVLKAEPVIEHPVAELAGASRLSRGDVDELLGEFQGPVRELLPGHMVMALIARRLRLGEITAAYGVRVAMALARAKELTVDEYLEVDSLDDELQLAGQGVYSTPDAVTREIGEHFARYDTYATELPATLVGSTG